MNNIFLEYLKCTKCNRGMENASCTKDSIKCSCGEKFVLINGVPNFLDKSKVHSKSKNLDKIDKSFSQQWHMFDYNGPNSKTWDWDIKERLINVFKELSIRPSDLKNKTLLDAGCGNGVLTTHLSLFGCLSIGIDISDSIFLVGEGTRKITKKDSNIFFLKGSLTKPPLKDKKFDYIYSSGVLHHNIDTKEVLFSLCPLLKDDGRIFVWLYGKSTMATLFSQPLRRITTRLPLPLLSGMTYLLAYPFKIIRIMANILGIQKYPSKTINELQLSLHDTFSPTYAHHHTEDELLSWFKELGFTKSKVTARTRNGFGIWASGKI